MNKGAIYEDKAVEFLKLNGYKILMRNFHSPWGEIDIVAKDKKYIAFVEVRARGKRGLISPLETIDRKKQSKIELTAKVYYQMSPNKSYRFDTLSITDAGNYCLYELIKGAFYVDEKREF
ncbi:MAG: YraN family protein [Candidatus Omnitrophica bacterium]|nr:YraN family protein [Candidatus Omnitrophota bacterium]